MNTIILPCAKGCEQVLASEAQRLGLCDVRIGVAMVMGRGELLVAYALCLWSRVASRVLWQVAEGEINAVSELYDLVYAIDWQAHLSPNTTFAVEFTGQGQGINNTVFGALKVKDAVVDKLRAVYKRRPDIDTERPNVRIHAHLYKGRVSIALDLSGGNLAARGYRLAQGAAPIRENVAATLLYRAGWHEKAANCSALIDPMCGSGTLLCEAVMMAADIAPALSRLRFGFEHWLGHIPAKWRGLREEALERRETGLSNWQASNQKSGQCLVLGFDENQSVLAAARENLARLGLSQLIHLKQQRLADLHVNPSWGEQGLMICNPPYGERIGQVHELLDIYSTLGAKFKALPIGWEMTLISSNEAMLQRLRLRASKDYQAFNGQLACRIRHYVRAAQPEAVGETVAMRWSDGAEMFANRLRKNIKNIEKLAKKVPTNAYRLYDQDLPEYAVAIDRYGDYVHLQEYAPPATVDEVKAKQRLLDVMAVVPEVLGVAPDKVVVKTRARQSGNQQYQKHDAREETFVVEEGQAKFWVNLQDYLDTGLFLDHRPMRLALGQLAKGKRFLNLFCYTASATVHAALGGASYSTSVDASNTYLKWAERNFSLNQLSSRHRCEKADVMAWLLAGNSQFDLIFCDPPTFSNSKKSQRLFDVQRDHSELIKRAMARLAADGELYFSNNYRRFKLDPTLSEQFEIQDISAATIDFDFKRRSNIHRTYRICHRKA